ncbi:MAG: DEAD/DEAH box helicase [Henriciella sp.]|jgi:ATP-dependent RNA helicase RhlE|nr:DEAD/DEAH box helicase [Henriciella sp.]MBO6694727.1 DEAD/DEAH box helicase [Henriciella sp.]
MDLHKQVLKAVTAEGYDTPTPIQAQAIPHLLEGRDMLGIAQTGTGKTAAFALPTLDFLLDEPENRKPKHTRVLVLAPTRELAGQIADSFRTYSKFMECVTQTVFGGVKINRQIRDLQKGCHVLVATPGRLLDLMNQGAVRLSDVEVLILDEADQMLDMGFIHDLKKIIAQVPDDRQTLLFSATMPKLIEDLAGKYLDDPVRVSVAPESTTAERVSQGVLHVPNNHKLSVLGKLLEDPGIDRALVFTRTKHGADKVVRKLMAKGHKAQAIHGNKSQPQRLKALNAFKNGDCRVLIATDIAARGIDIDGISHVINFEMPNIAEQYVHRIGRTARAGREGVSISMVAEDELYYLREVEKVTRVAVEVLPTPEGCEDYILPTPDASVRVRKPKGPSRRSGKPPQRDSRRNRPEGVSKTKQRSRKRPGKNQRNRDRANVSA